MTMEAVENKIEQLFGLKHDEGGTLREPVYSLFLVGGMVMQMRLFYSDEEFAQQLAQGGSARVMIAAQGPEGAQAWAPFFVSLAHVIGFAPMVETPKPEQSEQAANEGTSVINRADPAVH